MDEKLFKELIDMLDATRPSNTVEKLSPEQQEALARFFTLLAENLLEKGEDIKPEAICGQLAAAFCVGHDWVVKHWSLWKD